MLRILSIFAALFFAGSGCSSDSKKLDTIDAELQAAYPNISPITAAHVNQWQANNKDIVLIDVRQESEYAVSHIEGALRIDPKASASEVAKQIGSIASGKDVIFYCSVGVRSSQLADRAKDALQAMGAGDIYNVSGGIFAWHNEKRALMNDTGETQMVHPYDRTWGKLVNRQNYVSYEP